MLVSEEKLLLFLAEKVVNQPDRRTRKDIDLHLQ
jgi:hypothetical protein